jgi:hypothetical protein
VNGLPPLPLGDEERDRLLATTGDEGFEVLWAKVEAEWSDEKIHIALLEYAISRKLMPEAAGRYRVMRDDDAKRAVAEKRLNAIVTAATFMLEQTRTVAPERTNRKLSYLGFAVSLLLLTWLAFVIFRR